MWMWMERRVGKVALSWKKQEETFEGVDKDVTHVILLYPMVKIYY